MDAVGGSWAGTLVCSQCRKKRLTAESFSANQLRQLRERKISEDKLKCKECVAKAAAAERERWAPLLSVCRCVEEYGATMLFRCVRSNASKFENMRGR